MTVGLSNVNFMLPYKVDHLKGVKPFVLAFHWFAHCIDAISSRQGVDMIAMNRFVYTVFL